MRAALAGGMIHFHSALSEKKGAMNDAVDPVPILLDLLALCGDAIAGYRAAAAAVRTPEYRRMLEEIAIEREEVASVLTYKLVELGAEPPHHGSLAGALHRHWLRVTSHLEHDDRTLLKLCAGGERETIAHLSKALGRPLTDDVHRAIQSQLGRVLSASATLQRLIIDCPRSFRLVE